MSRRSSARRWKALAAALAISAVLASLSRADAQPPTPQPAQTQPASPAEPPPVEPPRPAGTVLFSRDLSTDPNAPANAQPPAVPANSAPELTLAPNEPDPLKVTGAERNALTFTAYDLDLHLTPASAGISVRAGLTVRNDSPAPLARLIFQITSSMHWDHFSAPSLAASASSSKLDFTARRIATDADHTGWAEEAVVTLPQPLAPGASIALTALYSGAIPQSAERLERIGAPPAEAAAADWDAIDSNATALRGFGDVLWYPVAAPPVFLGDGAKLFQAIGRARLRQATATIRLRLAIEYVGDPPNAAFFCGRREQLNAISDNANLPVVESPGVATAVFDPQPLGFRNPSLFVTAYAPSQINPSPDQTDAGLIAAVTDHYDALPAYSAAAALVEPLLTDWFGPHPLTTLNLIDHSGQPFEDDTLLVRPMTLDTGPALAPSLAHSLTHVWIHSSHAWIDEGLAQFAGLLWTERSKGRAAALDELQEAARTLALAEPESESDAGPDASGSAGSTRNVSASAPSSSAEAPQPANSADAGYQSTAQSLIDATNDLYYRTKAAAVWWMLRSITGDDALKQALQAYRLDPKLDRDPTGLQHTLEKFSHKDLRWFFDNWVYQDRGLPDLTIVNVTPRQIDAHNGIPDGWLIAVEVRNDGDAEAEVPLRVRSAAGTGAATETQTLRIPGHSSVSRRIVFAGTPVEVQVNDGGVPETRGSIHTRQLVLPRQ